MLGEPRVELPWRVARAGRISFFFFHFHHVWDQGGMHCRGLQRRNASRPKEKSLAFNVWHGIGVF